MKIGLINTYSTHNLGDSAIYSALAKLASNNHVVATVQDERPLYTPGVEFASALPACGAYLSVGGDIYNNGRKYLVTRQFLRNLSELYSAPKRTFIFGQSIPRSCQYLSFQLLAQVFKRLPAVCVRDKESYCRLMKAGVKAKLSFDAAFALAVNENAELAGKLAFGTLAIEPDKAALISLRGFDQMYQHNNEVFIQKLATLCELLSERNYQPVLLLQSDAYGADQDKEIAERIHALQPNTQILDVFRYASDVLSGWQVLIGVLSLAGIAVGVRYHTSVLRMAAGRIPYNLYYSNKGQDLSTRLHVPGCALESFDPAAELYNIERTQDMPFNDSRIRQRVEEDFAESLAAICHGKTGKALKQAVYA